MKSTARKTRKRNVVSSDESEYDAREDVLNVISSSSKRSAGKKVVETVANVPIDKVSFHLPENAQIWKYIFHIRLALERELGKEAIKMEEVMSMIKEAGLLKTVCNIGDCYEKLMREFLVNVLEDCNNPLSQEYQKVYVIAECVNFSPNIINRFSGIEKEGVAPLKVTDNQIYREITTNQVKEFGLRREKFPQESSQ